MKENGRGGVAKKEKKGEEKCLNLLLSRIVLNIEIIRFSS